MPDFDPNTAEVAADEVHTTARTAAYAIVNGQPPPLDTPLQRDAAEAAEDVLAQLVRQSRMARLRARVQN